MELQHIARREFLRTAALTGAALAAPGLLAACGGNADPEEARTLKELLEALRANGAAPGLSIFLAGEDYVVGIDNYLGFGLVRDRAGPITDADARVWVVPTADPTASAPIHGGATASWQRYAKPDAPLPAPQGINATTLRFDRPGIWTLVANVTAGEARLVGRAAVQVKEKASTRIPGEKAIPTETPTVGDHRGVEPICTRKPACDFHRVTLAKALSLGKPVAFMVATPAFCMSRTCGPNLEELIAVAAEVGDRATFIHAEVYKDDKPETISRGVVSPTYREWGFVSEPWLFLIDRDGVIRSRFEGPVTASVIHPALDPLLT